LTILAAAVHGQDRCATSMKIISPLPNQVVSSQDQVNIEAVTTPNLGFAASDAVVSAAIVATGRGTSYMIASGDLRLNDSPGVIGGLWDLANVASGSYTITVTMHSRFGIHYCQPLEASVPVTVNRAPSLSGLQLISCSTGPSGTAASFLIAAKDPEGDPLSL